MTDRELLELAAKAAGVKGGFEQDPAYKWQERERWVIPYNNNGLMTGVVWNPLADDGDALRLAVKLLIDVSFDEMHVVCSTNTAMTDAPGEPINVDDPCAAVRRAIVRAAAEIGKAKP